MKKHWLTYGTALLLMAGVLGWQWHHAFQRGNAPSGEVWMVLFASFFTAALMRAWTWNEAIRSAEAADRDPRMAAIQFIRMKPRHWMVVLVFAAAGAWEILSMAGDSAPRWLWDTGMAIPTTFLFVGLLLPPPRLARLMHEQMFGRASTKGKETFNH